MEREEASSRLESLGLTAEALHEGLERSGDESDPRWAELGTTLGTMYALCSCNAEIAEETACEEFRTMMEANFDL